MSKDTTEAYLVYVQDALSRFGRIGNLMREDQILPQDVNYGLANFLPSLFAVIGEYQRCKLENLDIEEDYKRWYDQKFDEAKARVIQEYKTQEITTKPNLKEIETRLRNYFRVEYDDWQDKLKVSNAEVRFILRVLNSYQKFDNVLTNLSQNMRTEMRALSLEGRANVGEGTKIATNKVRTRFPTPTGRRLPKGE